MKLSAIPEREQYPHRDIAPVIRSLTDAWDPDRLIYGGGFNARATPESYRGYRARLAEHLAHLSATDQARVFGGTAARLFGFKAEALPPHGSRGTSARRPDRTGTGRPA